MSFPWRSPCQGRCRHWQSPPPVHCTTYPCCKIGMHQQITPGQPKIHSWCTPDARLAMDLTSQITSYQHYAHFTVSLFGNHVQCKPYHSYICTLSYTAFKSLERWGVLKVILNSNNQSKNRFRLFRSREGRVGPIDPVNQLAIMPNISAADLKYD